MAGEKMGPWIEGEVSALLCRSCGKHTPYLTLSGDTDMVTNGLVSLSSIERNEIVVADTHGNELRDKDGAATLGRVSGQLNRSDLRIVRLLRAESLDVKAGPGFQAFVENHRPPSMIFSCPHCLTGEAKVEKRLSLAEYRREGGKLTILPDLEIRA
ncbi:MAG: hypothetical protein J0I19_16580 [Alphaproteobacteria bacterium]|nr:hypothetical protein [Alphaproteobacteria bacterium]